MNVPFLRSPRFIVGTLLVLAAVGVMIRLGFWQLERLEQRRAYNVRVGAALNAPALDVNVSNFSSLEGEEYRTASLRGTFLTEEAVLLRNQAWEGQLGYDLLVPLELKGRDEAVLVNLGWIPKEQAQAYGQYVPAGEVAVMGMIRRTQQKTGLWGVADPPLADGETRRSQWNFVTVGRIAEQTSLPLAPVYVQRMPDPARLDLPYAHVPQIDLSEGSHFGYALQWFAFALIFAIGYGAFVRRKMTRRSDDSEKSIAARPAPGKIE